MLQFAKFNTPNSWGCFPTVFLKRIDIDSKFYWFFVPCAQDIKFALRINQVDLLLIRHPELEHIKLKDWIERLDDLLKTTNTRKFPNDNAVTLSKKCLQL